MRLNKKKIKPAATRGIRTFPTLHDSRHNYPTTTAEEEPYKFNHAHYATALEVWELQEPSMAKILKKLLPLSEFNAWKDSYEKKCRTEREQEEAQAVAAKKLEEAAKQLNAVTKK